MAKYQFTDAQRFAIYVAHGEKCYMCSQSIDLSSMQVDHVIPQGQTTVFVDTVCACAHHLRDAAGELG